MPYYCCVPGCTEKKGGHRFPKDPALNLKWCINIKRTDASKKLWQPKKTDVVCRDHFEPDCFTIGSCDDYRRLKVNAVPTIFNFNKELTDSARKRKTRMDDEKYKENEVSVPDMATEVEIATGNDAVEEEEMHDQVDESSNSVGSQCLLLNDKEFSIEQYESNDEFVSFYTGFSCYAHFMLFFTILGPAVNHLAYQCKLLSPKNQLFLTLIKLRRAREDRDLAFMFNIGKTTVTNLIRTWINFMYFQLKEIDIWPSRENTDLHMPKDFKKKFGKTHVILDATEIPIEKPTNVAAQCATFSTYKHKNTLKTMIGCSPGSLITHISDCYGGSASDRQIIERSDICHKAKELFDKGDQIMADRGIMVQDLFAMNDITINTPTMLKGKSQLEPKDVLHDRRVAPKRIHIERKIGLSKTYRILKRDLSQQKLCMGNRIIYVCFALTNFRTGIVNKFA